MKKLYCIHEFDYADSERDVIGIADNLDAIPEMIDEYYGKDCIHELKFFDVRDGNIEWKRV